MDYCGVQMLFPKSSRASLHPGNWPSLNGHSHNDGPSNSLDSISISHTGAVLVVQVCSRRFKRATSMTHNRHCIRTLIDSDRGSNVLYTVITTIIIISSRFCSPSFPTRLVLDLRVYLFHLFMFSHLLHSCMIESFDPSRTIPLPS